jgi:hypothetical protein
MARGRTVAIACAAALALQLAGAAGARAEEGAKGSSPLGTAGSVGDALARLGAGTSVELVLANGKSYRGRLASVGGETVLLTELAGKEFFDALIRLDAIAAVEVRARGN